MNRRRSSFYWAMRLLPAPRRRAMFALYDYAQALDHIADEGDDRDTARARLAVWRAALTAWRESGIALHPELAALAPFIRAHDLPLSELELLIDGMEQDVNLPLTAPEPEALELYCRQVAGTIGMLTIRILGRPDAGDFALALARALQMTNILRDVGEDAARGRLYLPRDCLERAGIVTPGPQAVISHPALAMACQDFANQTRAAFARADDALQSCGRRGLWPAVAMMATYRAQLARLGTAHDWRQPAPRLPRWHRAAIALKACLWP